MSINANYGLDWLNHSQSFPAIDPRAYGLSLSGEEEAYFSGFYWNSAFTIAGEQLPAPVENDVFVGHLERSDGSITWLKNGSGNSFDATKCMTSSDGSIWVGGEFYSDVFDYEGETFTNTTDGENDGFLFSLDTDSKPKCGLQLEGTGQNGILQVESFGDGHVALLAYLNGTVEFGGQTYEAQGNVDLLVIKTCLPCDTLTGVKEILNANEFVLLQNVPNPFAERTTITYLIPTDATRAEIVFHNALGQQVKSVSIKDTGAGSLNVFAADLSTGIYTYTLVIDGNVVDSKKMTKTD